MNKLQDFDESKLLRNPFSYTLKIRVTKRLDSAKLVPDKDGIMLPAASLMERTPATKIFHAPGMLEIVCNLSDCALRLYVYIIYSLEPGRDYIRINTEKYLHQNSIKDLRTYKTASKELIRYNFIVGTEFDNVFWINPNILFCGSRIIKYPENLVVVGEWSA